MEVQFHKNVTYKSRVGIPIIISISRRTSGYAIVEVESSEKEYPEISKRQIRKSEDGREFIDLSVNDIHCRVWATDAER